MNNYKYLLSCVSGVALLLSQTNISFASNQNDIQLNAKPLPSCSIKSVEDMHIGEVYGSKSNEQKLGIVTSHCSHDVTIEFYTDHGENAINNDTQRRMHDGNGNYIEYHLFKHVEGSEIDTELWAPNTKFTQNYMKGKGIQDDHKLYLHIDNIHIKNLSAGHGVTFSDRVNITVKVMPAA